MPLRFPVLLRLPAVAILAVGSLSIGGCGKQAATRSNRVPVTVARVERRPMPLALLATGTVEPIQTADVGSQVGGAVTRIDFKEGDEVRAGQPLFELDPRPFRSALAQAQGQLARDRAQAAASTVAAQRAATLFEQHLISQQDWDAARATADAQQASVQADSAASAAARLNLEFATIRSPIAGRAGRFMVHMGDYVKAATSEPLVTVNQMRPIDVRFTVPESARPMIERYRHADPRVFVHASGDSVEIEGRLAFVDNAIDPATGTLTLKGEFPNADGKLWPGDFVEVRLVLDVQKDALVVPFPALGNGQQGTYVYVVNPDSSATMKPVVVLRADDATAVLAGGVDPGELVVTDGQFRISPGAKLVIRDPNAARGAGAKAGRRGTGSQKPAARP